MSKNEDKLLEIPSQLETDRLILRSYRAGDGQFFFDMVENGNREHLKEILGYITETKDVNKIEIWIQGLAADWHAHNRFVLSFWEKHTCKFFGHIWMEPIDWKIPLFEMGWFVKKGI